MQVTLQYVAPQAIREIEQNFKINYTPEERAKMSAAVAQRTIITEMLLVAVVRIDGATPFKLRNIFGMDPAKIGKDKLHQPVPLISAMTVENKLARKNLKSLLEMSDKFVQWVQALATDIGRFQSDEIEALAKN